MKKYTIIFLLFYFIKGATAQTNPTIQALEAMQKALNSIQKKGKVVFYAPKYPDCEVTYIQINIDDKKGIIKTFDDVPSCRNADPKSYPIFELAPGSYKFTGFDMCGNNYYGNVTIISGQCKLFELYMP